MPLSHHSRFFQRLHRRYGAELTPAAAGRARARPPWKQAWTPCCARGHDLGAALRILRQLVMERLIRLDCDQGRRWPTSPAP